MNRFSLVALIFSVAPALAHGEQPTLPTVAPAVPLTMAAVTTSPFPVSCSPTLMQPLCVTPTVPPPIGTCVTYSEKRPGVFQSLLNCFRRPATCDTCSPTSCPAPPPIRIQVATGCATGSCPTTRPRIMARPAASGFCWAQFKTWLCWKPCNEQIIPAFRLEPYRAPLLAYFPKCEQPAAPLPCGTCGHAKHGPRCATPGCPTTPCATGGCPTAYGPTVSPWAYSGTTAMPMTAPIPSAPMPPATEPQVNLLARPFTSP